MNGEIIEHEGGFDGQAVSMVQSLQKADIDQQIATAHAYPRSLTRVARAILGLVTMSAASAQECTYALPRGGKPITGPSIRLAEAVFSQWGNARGGARVVHVDRKEMFVEAEGIFWDLETNAATTKRVRRRISDKYGKLLTEDMIIVTGNAACSIAFRNAVLAGVPKMMWSEAYDAALKTIKGDMKTLPERKGEAMKAMAAFGLKPEQVYAILGVAGDRDVGLDELVLIGGMHSALKNDETTVEELLKTVEAEPPKATSAVTKKTTPTLAAQQEERKAKAEVKSDPAPADDADKAREEQIAKREAQKAARDKAAEEKPAEKVREIEEPKPVEVVDEETGEVTEAPNEEAFMALYDTIVEDMMGAIGNEGIEEVLTLYEVQIDHMKVHFPDMHRRLMEEVEAAKE